MGFSDNEEYFEQDIDTKFASRITLWGGRAGVMPRIFPFNRHRLTLTVDDNAGNATQARPRVTERQAVEIARQRFAGNVLRISLIGEGDNQRYQIRMENEGKVFTVFVNVITGRISGGG